MKKLPRKRRTREHVLADLSVNFVERQALLCGHVAQRTLHDYGIDLEIFTFTRRGEPQSGVIKVQVTATSQIRRRKAVKTVTYRIERRDLASWIADPMPVILILYDAKRDRSYWLYVQSYFADLKEADLFALGKTVTVHIPLSNVLDTAAIERFAEFRDRVLRQMEIYHEE